MKSFMIEYYPDMQGDNYGGKVFTIRYAVNNWKRFKSLDDKSKKQLLTQINRFEEVIQIFKERLNSEQNPEECDARDDEQGAEAGKQNNL